MNPQKAFSGPHQVWLRVPQIPWSWSSFFSKLAMMWKNIRYPFLDKAKFLENHGKPWQNRRKTKENHEKPMEIRFPKNNHRSTCPLGPGPFFQGAQDLGLRNLHALGAAICGRDVHQPGNWAANLWQLQWEIMATYGKTMKHPRNSESLS